MEVRGLFVSPSDEKHAQIPSYRNGTFGGEVEERASSCFKLPDVPSVDTVDETAKIISVTDFLYHDPNAPYKPLPEHDLDQSPHYPIIAIKKGYFYCKLHPDVQNVHLESVEHHVKYKDPDKHKSELLKFKPTYD